MTCQESKHAKKSLKAGITNNILTYKMSAVVMNTSKPTMSEFSIIVSKKSSAIVVHEDPKQVTETISTL